MGADDQVLTDITMETGGMEITETTMVTGGKDSAEITMETGGKDITEITMVTMTERRIVVAMSGLRVREGKVAIGILLKIPHSKK